MMSRAVKRIALRALGLVALARTAIRLRFHKREHGGYPATFGTLTDPFDGKPLGYLPVSNGFKLWSVGENLRDEGGNRFNDILWEWSR